MIIVGTKALEYHGIYSRAKDIDVIATEKHSSFDTIVLPEHIIEMFPVINGHATLDALYTLCCSHLGWDIKWQKHKQRALLMQHHGATIITELYEQLKDFWKQENGNKEYLSLYKKKDDFFNDHVTYVYDHDYLHELVAYPDKPVYTYCLKENEDVAIDKSKFDRLPLEQQLRMFKEEISVIAAERWLIPPKVKGKYTWTQAYCFALHKTVTSLTKNWATDFIIEHLKFFNQPDYMYFGHLFKTIKEGEIYMSKVDMSVFEEIKSYFDDSADIRGIIVDLATSVFDKFKWNGCFSKYKTDLAKFEEEYGYEHLEQDGGGEGGSEYCYGVFKLKGKIYKTEWSYYSFHGYELENIVENLREVQPKEKTIIVYE